MEKRYHISGHTLLLTGDRWPHVVEQLDGFAPFVSELSGKDSSSGEESADCVLGDGSSLPCPAWLKELYRFEYDNSTSVFGTTADGYRLDLHASDDTGTLHLWMDTHSGKGYLQGNPDLSLVRFALWTALGIALAPKGSLAIHSSCLVYKGKAVMCLGESGTGKSTHTRLWRTHIPGTTLLNDDSPWVRLEDDGTVRVYGSPWSGKTPCYKAESYPLVACLRLSQAPVNEIRRLPVVQAYGALHPSASPAFAYDDALYDAVSEVLGRMVETVPVYHLRCLPNREAVGLALHTLFGEELQNENA